MENIIKTIRKKGLIEKKKLTLNEVMEYDLSDPDEYVEYITQKLLDQLSRYMSVHQLNQSDLARRMSLTRQAISKKFIGHNLTISWLVKAIVTMGGKVNLKALFPHSKKKPSKRELFSLKSASLL